MHAGQQARPVMAAAAAAVMATVLGEGTMPRRIHQMHVCCCKQPKTEACRVDQKSSCQREPSIADTTQ
jgi:hypothetical protein